MARHGQERPPHLKALLYDEAMAHELAEHGRQTILSRYMCAHRVDELLAMYAELSGEQLEGMKDKCAAD